MTVSSLKGTGNKLGPLERTEVLSRPKSSLQTSEDLLLMEILQTLAYTFFLCLSQELTVFPSKDVPHGVS